MTSKKQKENDHALKNFNLNSLDSCEMLLYNDFSQSVGKIDALKEVINFANGDESQLSDALLEVAQETNLI